jgi:hypothetical protein
MADGKPKPAITFRSGRIDVAVWANEHRQEDGSTVTRHSMTLRKSWRPKDSQDWREQTVTLFLDELPVVKALLDAAYHQFGIDTKF